MKFLLRLVRFLNIYDIHFLVIRDLILCELQLRHHLFYKLNLLSMFLVMYKLFFCVF